MGELFKHFQGYDVQATRKEEREKITEEAIMFLVQSIQEICNSKETAKEQLRKRYQLDAATAEEKVEQYWEVIEK